MIFGSKSLTSLQVPLCIRRDVHLDAASANKRNPKPEERWPRYTSKQSAKDVEHQILRENDCDLVVVEAVLCTHIFYGEERWLPTPYQYNQRRLQGQQWSLANPRGNCPKQFLSDRNLHLILQNPSTSPPSAPSRGSRCHMCPLRLLVPNWFSRNLYLQRRHHQWSMCQSPFWEEARTQRRG